MILTIDAGNSNICLGAYEDRWPVFTARLRTDALRTETEYAVLFKEIFDLHGVDSTRFEGAAISCVVPVLTPILSEAVRLIREVPVLVIGPGVRTGINLRIDEPASAGADLVCTAAGAAEKYPLPAIVVDLGTATKITVVDASRSFRGGMIAPGVEVSLGALSASAALLPSVGLDRNVKLIGTNTVDCIVSGSVYGTASMIDGMVDRFREQLGDVKTVVACGGLAPQIIPHCKNEILLDRSLLLDGLLAIYRRNR